MSGTTDMFFSSPLFSFFKTLKRSLCAAMARRMSHHLAAASTTGGPIRNTLFLGNRSYGSSAAAVYDYYSEDEYGEMLREPQLGTGKSVPGRGVQWVIMGDRGAKKHLFAERLSKLLEVPHISMGSLVRQELNPRSSLYKKIATAVNESKLVPEDVIFTLLSRRLEEAYYKGETGFILEGIPRTRMQAKILDQIADIDMVLNFKCPVESTSLEKSSSVLRMKSQGEQLISANLAWKEKFAFYAEQSKLLEDYYAKQRKLLNFEITPSGAGETWKGLLAALHLQHMNAAIDSPQKLTA